MDTEDWEVYKENKCCPICGGSPYHWEGIGHRWGEFEVNHSAMFYYDKGKIRKVKAATITFREDK